MVTDISKKIETDFKKNKTNSKHIERRGGYRENGGRDRIDPSGRVVTVSFCLTPTENKIFREKLSQSNLSISAFMRKLIFENT